MWWNPNILFNLGQFTSPDLSSCILFSFVCFCLFCVVPWKRTFPVKINNCQFLVELGCCWCCFTWRMMGDGLVVDRMAIIQSPRTSFLKPKLQTTFEIPLKEPFPYHFQTPNVDNKIAILSPTSCPLNQNNYMQEYFVVELLLEELHVPHAVAQAQTHNLQ